MIFQQWLEKWVSKSNFVNKDIQDAAVERKMFEDPCFRNVSEICCLCLEEWWPLHSELDRMPLPCGLQDTLVYMHYFTISVPANVWACLTRKHTLPQASRRWKVFLSPTRSLSGQYAASGGFRFFRLCQLKAGIQQTPHGSQPAPWKALNKHNINRTVNHFLAHIPDQKKTSCLFMTFVDHR